MRRNHACDFPAKEHSPSGAVKPPQSGPTAKPNAAVGGSQGNSFHTIRNSVIGGKSFQKIQIATFYRYHVFSCSLGELETRLTPKIN